jgi:hypothetical protein
MRASWSSSAAHATSRRLLRAVLFHQNSGGAGDIKLAGHSGGNSAWTFFALVAYETVAMLLRPD